jgi:hypothetical protein
LEVKEDEFEEEEFLASKDEVEDAYSKDGRDRQHNFKQQEDTLSERINPRHENEQCRFKQELRGEVYLNIPYIKIPSKLEVLIR